MTGGLLLAAAAASLHSIFGPYPIQLTSYNDSGLDPTAQRIDVLTPLGSPGERFPFIVYAHGFDNRGEIDYTRLGQDLASWGFVVAFPKSCHLGCKADCRTLPFDPPCFADYYKQQLRVIEWSRFPEIRAVLPVDERLPVGVAGHSMGGQVRAGRTDAPKVTSGAVATDEALDAPKATAFSAAFNASSHQIGAAVMHHPFTHQYPPIGIPFLAFTGTRDETAPPRFSESLFDAPGACDTRALANKRGANHHEPSHTYNPALTRYTAAWFKLFLLPSQGRPGSEGAVPGADFEALVFGHGPDSLCFGGDGPMERCEVRRGLPVTTAE